MVVEGCISLPDFPPMEVVRHARVRVDYSDPAGLRSSVSLEGYPAAVLQHELDHLDGVLYIDRV